jgi:Tfp pilus assembly protein PilZ
MDFSVIIPRMREAIQEYMARKVAQGRPLSEREAIIRWMDRYYETWLSSQVGLVQEAAKDSGPDKRRHRRTPIEVSAYYRVLWTPQGDVPAENTLSKPAKIENISAGGLFIVTGRPYPISTLVEIQFELPGVPESISAFAMVVWRQERSGGRYGLGLHFSHIELSQADLINEMIMERLLEAPVVTVSGNR